MIAVGLGIIVGAVADLRLETAAAERILWAQKAAAYAHSHTWMPAETHKGGIRR